MSHMSPTDVARQLGGGLLSFPVTHFDEGGQFLEAPYREHCAWMLDHELAGLFAAVAPPVSVAEQGYADLHLDKQLCLALQISSSLVTKIYRGLLEPLGLTHPQYLVLIALWQQTERCSMGDLRRALCMDTGAVTPLVKRMEANGLLKRSRDVADERRVWVDLTDAGWALRDQVV